MSQTSGGSSTTSASARILAGTTSTASSTSGTSFFTSASLFFSSSSRFASWRQENGDDDKTKAARHVWNGEALDFPALLVGRGRPLLVHPPRLEHHHLSPSGSL